MTKEEVAGPASEAGPSGRPAPTGLVNLGNSCYFNSSLQLLAACEAVSQELATQRNSLGKGPLGFAFQQALLHLNSSGVLKQQHQQRRRNAYDPQALLAALCRVVPSFAGNQQHDAHEALHALLEGLQDEQAKLQAMFSRSSSLGGRQSADSPSPSPSTVSAVLAGGSPSKAAAERGLSGASVPTHPSAVQSPPQATENAAANSVSVSSLAVTSLFRGQLRSTVTCHTCQHSSVTLEPFLELSLPIPTAQQLQQLRTARTGHEATSTGSATEPAARGPHADGVHCEDTQRAPAAKYSRAKKGRSAASKGGASEEGKDVHGAESQPSAHATQRTRDAPVRLTKVSQKEIRRKKAEEKRLGIAAKRQARKGQARGSGSSGSEDDSASDASETVAEPRLLGGMPVAPLSESPSSSLQQGALDGSLGSDKHELQSEPSTVITGFHVLPRTSTNGSTNSPSSSNADTSSHHSPMAEGGLSHYLKGPAGAAEDGAAQPTRAAARRAAASKTPPEVSDCLELFFAPETVVWECAEEKRAIRALSSSPVNSLTHPLGSLQGPLGSITLSPAAAASPQLTSALAAVAALHAGKPLPSPPAASPPPAAVLGSPSGAAGSLSPLASADSTPFVTPASVPIQGVYSVDITESPLGSLLSSLPVPTSVLVPKKVRFSPLPPMIHYIPGSREQRGTDVEAALRGEVPFVRPACAPLPAHLPTAKELRAEAHAAAKSKGKGKGKGRGQATRYDSTDSDTPRPATSDTLPATLRKGKKSKSSPLGPEQYFKSDSTNSNTVGTSDGVETERDQAETQEGKEIGAKGGDKGESATVHLTKSERKAKKREAQRAAARTVRPGGASGESDGDAASHLSESSRAGAGDEDGGVGDVGSGGECYEDVWLAEAARERARGPALARGLLIHAQIDPADRNNLSVRLVAGVSADPKEVAAVIPRRHRSSRRGAPLCRANIAGVWARDYSATIPSLTPAPSPPPRPVLHPSSTLLHTTDTDSPSKDGDWDHEPDLESESDPDDRIDGPVDAGGLQIVATHRPTEAQSLIARAGDAEVGLGGEGVAAPESESGGEGSSGSGEEDSGKEQLCDVCDAVQVVMDCAAHMVLTQGVDPAFHSLGMGAPLRVYHDFGGWRVAGTHADTKESWVYPDSFTQDIHDPTTDSLRRTTTSGDAGEARGLFPGVSNEDGAAPRLLGGHQELASPRRPASPTADAQAAEAACCSDNVTARDGAAAASDVPVHSVVEGVFATEVEVESAATHASSQGVPCVRHSGSGAAVALSPLPSLSPSPMTGSSPRPGNTGRLKRPENSLFQRPAVKVFSIQTAPKLLLVHLKRFQMTSLGRGSLRGGWVKVDTHVVFPRVLDIAPYMATATHAGGAGTLEFPTPFATQPPQAAASPTDAAQGTRYRLTALIEHQGTMRSGHYVTYTRHVITPPTNPDTCDRSSTSGTSAHTRPTSTRSKRGKGKRPGEPERGEEPSTDRWYLVNDETVREVPESKVLAAQAYVLLYERQEQMCAETAPSIVA